MQPWPPPLMSKIRRVAPRGQRGLLGHVLKHVETTDDGIKIVVRWWRSAKQRWEYEVVDEVAWEVGLWKPELPG